MRGCLIVVGSGAAGFVIGYFTSVFYACSGENAGNLCGLLGVFITGPIGGIAGIAIALKMLGRRSQHN